MKSKPPLLFALLFLVAIAGCDSKPSASTTMQPRFQPVQVPVLPSNRFQLVSSSGAQLALDTQTGKVCKTHDWPQLNNATIPLCFDLYKQLPSVGKLQEVKVWGKDSAGKTVQTGVTQEFVIPLHEESQSDLQGKWNPKTGRYE